MRVRKNLSHKLEWKREREKRGREGEGEGERERERGQLNCFLDKTRGKEMLNTVEKKKL